MSALEVRTLIGPTRSRHVQDASIVAAAGDVNVGAATEALVKDIVFSGAAFMTAAGSLRAARARQQT